MYYFYVSYIKLCIIYLLPDGGHTLTDKFNNIKQAKRHVISEFIDTIETIIQHLKPRKYGIIHYIYEGVFLWLK